MRGSVNQNDLKEALFLAQGISQSKISNAIVDNTVLRIEGDHMDILATNLSISVRVRLPVVEAEDGEIALPVKLIGQAIRELPNGKVSLEALQNEVLVKAERSEYRLAFLTTENFPAFLPQVEGTTIIMPASLARTAMAKTVFTCSEERSRYQLDGVQFSYKDGKATWVATDGRRLSIVVNALDDPSIPETSLLIPSKAVQEVIRALPDTGDVKITLGERRILFEMGENDRITIASTLLENNFPPYQLLLHESYPIRINLDRDQLSAAIRRVSVLANEKSHLLELAAKEKTLVVSGERYETGGAVSEIDADIESEGATVKYNASYLSELMRVISPGKITWSLVKDGGAAYFTEENDKSFTHIVMPLAVKEQTPAADSPRKDARDEEDEED